MQAITSNLNLHPFPNIAKKAAEAFLRKSRKDKILPVLPAVIVNQLPLWPESVRCLPNEFLHSALFNAKNQNQPRSNYKEFCVPIIGDGQITYSGEELRQDDATVWLQLIHLSKERSLGATIDFTAYGFCKSINWPICKDSYIRLRSCLIRMQATALSLYSNRLKEGVSLSMIPRFRWRDEVTKRPLAKYQVELAPELVRLFGDLQYTQIEWKQRLDLPRGLATWLHGYYASHRKPYPIKLSTLKKGAGLTTVMNKHLKENVKKALNELMRVEFLKSWEIVGELIHVERF
ncbi:MAG TPA: plasmid replication initiator TrfA [Methylotenera sp.]|nr:plasmid replication initiator TrfA [Methylotenera sp.]